MNRAQLTNQTFTSCNCPRARMSRMLVVKNAVETTMSITPRTWCTSGWLLEESFIGENENRATRRGRWAKNVLVDGGPSRPVFGTEFSQRIPAATKESDRECGRHPPRARIATIQ